MNKKIAVLIGGRPQIIKAYPLLEELFNRRIAFFSIYSGQQFSKELFGDLFTELAITKPQYNLNLNQKNRSLEKMIDKISKVLCKEKPKVLVTFGDMDTTLAGAIAAYQTKTPLAHIEAGIRSGNKMMKEENNRIITDQLSSLLFIPNELAKQNLKSENILAKNNDKPSINNPLIINCGDIMQETLERLLKEIKLNKTKASHALLTIHRAENTDTKEKLIQLLKYVSNNTKQTRKIIFPVHPRIKKMLKKIKLPKKFILLKPAGYREMVRYVINSKIVFTDSGGLQKEACWLGRPCIVLRDETEWPQLIKARRAILYRDYKNIDQLKPQFEQLKLGVSRKIVDILNKDF